jgi:hypothetical protein
MELTTLALWTQVLSSIAVLGTVIYLAIEIKQKCRFSEFPNACSSFCRSTDGASEALRASRHCPFGHNA